MEYNYLGLTNRLLQMAKQTPITSMSSTINSMAYRAQLAVNDCLKDLAMQLKIKTRLVEFTFPTVAGQRNYCIPKRIAYPFVDLRQTATNNIIVNMPPNDYDLYNSSVVGIGNPQVYYLAGYQGVLKQTALTQSQIGFTSSVSDTSTVVIQGWNINDDYISEEVTLTGTVSAVTSNSYKFIDSISKIVTNGTITVIDESTVTLLSLSPKETHARYPVIGLGSVPADSITIYGRGYLTMPDLVNEYDMPLGLDDRALNAIVAGSMFFFMGYDPAVKNEGLGFYKDNYYDEIRKLKMDNTNDGVNYFMKSPYFGARYSGGVANPLEM